MGHFLLPFVLAALRAVHLLFLHQTGSSNPLGVSRNLDKSPFHPYFSIKDVFGFVLFICLRYFTLDSKQVGRCPCAGAICSYPSCYTFLREYNLKAAPSYHYQNYPFECSLTQLFYLPELGHARWKNPTY